MRRFVMMVALCGACFSSWAYGAGFDQLYDRLQQYDTQQRPNRNTPRDRYASYNEGAPVEPTPEPLAEPSVWDETGPAMGCADGSCDWEEPCYDGCPPLGLWGRAEYLQWWVRGSNTPPLVTTSPTGTPPTVAGILPNATVLFGNERINGQGRSGGRFTLGYWLGGCDTMGLENTFFFLGNVGDSYTQSSSGSPILARPFQNSLTGLQDAILIAYPNTVVGTVNVTSNSQVLGNELNLRRALYIDECRRYDMLVGYRYFHLNEDLDINTRSTAVGTAAPTGTSFSVLDSFMTRNNYNGGQLGLNAQYSRGRWTVDLLAKVALGSVSQTVTINGTTTATPPGGTAVTNRGGILALNSNIGQYTRNQFGVLPEFGVNLRYQISPLWRFNVGYTIMVLTNVVRPGDQISTNVDPNQFPPGISGNFPAFAFHDSDLWVQGVNLGLECNF